MGHISRRRFLAGTTAVAAGTTLLGRAPAALGQQVKELQVWHTEVEPRTCYLCGSQDEGGYGGQRPEASTKAPTMAPYARCATTVNIGVVPDTIVRRDESDDEYTGRISRKRAAVQPHDHALGGRDQIRITPRSMRMVLLPKVISRPLVPRIANSSTLGRRGRPVCGPHSRDIIAQTRTRNARGTDGTAHGVRATTGSAPR
jgi:hypothetical protein